jgi:hypothetical protein
MKYKLQDEYKRQPRIGRGNIKIGYVEYCNVIKVKNG